MAQVTRSRLSQADLFQERSPLGTEARIIRRGLNQLRDGRHRVILESRLRIERRHLRFLSLGQFCRKRLGEIRALDGAAREAIEGSIIRTCPKREQPLIMGPARKADAILSQTNPLDPWMEGCTDGCLDQGLNGPILSDGQFQRARRGVREKPEFEGWFAWLRCRPFDRVFLVDRPAVVDQPVQSLGAGCPRRARQSKSWRSSSWTHRVPLGEAPTLAPFQEDVKRRSFVRSVGSLP